MNEEIEVSEQDIPFHLLPQEEQQRIINANQKMVREAPTLHEWGIRVETPFVWLVISIPVGMYRSSYHLTPASNRCLVYATLVRTS
ncbi:hypothetical protein ACK307_17190, partial [Aeromonas caviae]